MEIVEKPGYLHIRVAGENSREHVLGYLADVRRACQERQIQVVLIEENLSGPALDLLDIFEIIAKASLDVQSAVKRIAYVDVNPQHGAAAMRFAETAATHRGVGVRVFPTVPAAAAWLTSFDPDE
jgi:hypothetical protein